MSFHYNVVGRRWWPDTRRNLQGRNSSKQFKLRVNTQCHGTCYQWLSVTIISLHSFQISNLSLSWKFHSLKAILAWRSSQLGGAVYTASLQYPYLENYSKTHTGTHGHHHRQSFRKDVLDLWRPWSTSSRRRKRSGSLRNWVKWRKKGI